MTPFSTPAIDSDTQATHALRVATAVSLCVVIAEWLHLEQPALAAWSTHMVMVQYTFSSFQKGVERILGRGLGILLALIIATLTRNAWGLGYLLQVLAIVPLFYLYFSGRLAYTFLNAGLYLSVVMELSRQDPTTVFSMAGDLFWAIVVGVVVATLVTWFSGAEQDLTIQAEGQPLLPLDGNRLRHSMMLAMTVIVVHIASNVLQLSPTTAIVSVMLLTITPDFQSLIHKGELRLWGALLAIVYGTAALLLLTRVPSLPLLVVAMFLGIYLAVGLARLTERWSYAGVQMGLVLPMVLVTRETELGSFTGALERVGGVLLALAASVLVGAVWAALGGAPPLPLAVLKQQAVQSQR